MPYIEEKDLLSLHSQVEKEQKTNNRLLDQVRIKSHEIQRVGQMKIVYLSVAIISLLALISVFVLLYLTPSLFIESNLLPSSSNDFSKDKLYDSISILDSKLKDCDIRVKQLLDVGSGFNSDERGSSGIQTKKTGKTSNVKKDFDTFSRGKTIYSVQIGAFKRLNLLLYSKEFVNFRGYQKGDMYTYALGNFTKETDAQNFKQYLKKLGFKDAFIVKYQN